MTQLIRDIGEKGLLAKLQRFCPAEIVGDDGAVIPTKPGHSLVVTTDVLVDQVHFSFRTTSPEDAGWRAVAANLSDLAAMGATPLGITVGLALPGDVAVSWVEKLYQGMNQCLQLHSTAIIGGDVCKSSVTTIAITAFGQVKPCYTIRRNAASVGDAIVVTGVHGASRAGLELLLHSELGQLLSSSDKLSLIKAHQRPQPRLDVLPELRLIAEESPRIAGMDSSDGLADAVIQLCQASSVGAIIERQDIPMPSAFSNWLSPEQALDYALYGGEDFELVLCMPLLPARAIVQKLGKGAAIIGMITANQSVILSDSNQTPDQLLTLDRSFQHF